jgi:hypothetical protein
VLKPGDDVDGATRDVVLANEGRGVGLTRRWRRVGCSRQLLFLCVLRSGVCSAPTGQWAARRLLKSSWFERRALEAAEVADGLRVSRFVGVSVTQNESGARAESALVAFRSSGGGLCPCR